ncbi:diacylglycerol O-acyltransferase 2-like [Latimeria chalumnae]|nr:PREDICTED: diacylglycerol O-acyltransferase 2-like isoform X2 [Latimeria chalumnae]|eukprot:XP_014351675.1 PREDICTED: diacylglycerol O-acyltransferase 2-like isoform X2 [Latimeria chalumnae]
MGLCCAILTGYLFFTSLWPLPALYSLWWISDWNTPERGGRRSDWVRKWMVWKHFRDYFPIKLIKTAELVSSENYLLGYHPHGIMSIGAFCNFGTEATGFSKTFPGIKPFLTTLSGNFLLPICRDYIMATGVCSVNTSSINYLLSQNGTGNAVVIVVGGATEALFCTQGKHIVALKERKGFIKVAIRNGSALVPVYSFGEGELFNQTLFDEDGWIRTLQRMVKKFVGIAPCLFHGRSIFSDTSSGIMPFSRPVNTVVGKPINVVKNENPSGQEIEKYHMLYIHSLLELFNNYKVKFGLSPTDELIIV